MRQHNDVHAAIFASSLGVSLLATGWNSAYPEAESRAGLKAMSSIKSRASRVARAVESSQFESNCLYE